jgi:hypothetical protein
MKRHITILYKIIGFTRRSVGMWCLQLNLKFLWWLNLETWPTCGVKTLPGSQMNIIIVLKNQFSHPFDFQLGYHSWWYQERIRPGCPSDAQVVFEGIYDTRLSLVITNFFVDFATNEVGWTNMLNEIMCLYC